MFKSLVVFATLISLLLSGCSPTIETTASEDRDESGHVDSLIVINQDSGNEPLVINNEPGNVNPAVGGYEEISVETLVDMMMTRRDTFLLINTLDYPPVNIPDTDLMITYDKLLANLDQLPEDKNAEIVLYCRSGNKSDIAAAELAQAGYTNVKNLLGGFVHWYNLGLPLVQP